MKAGYYAQVPSKYDNAEWTTGTVTNYDVSAQTLFVNCANPKYVSVRTDTTLTVRFNSASNPAITVNANTEADFSLDVHHMYITTTGASAVKIFMTE